MPTAAAKHLQASGPDSPTTTDVEILASRIGSTECRKRWRRMGTKFPVESERKGRIPALPAGRVAGLSVRDPVAALRQQQPSHQVPERERSGSQCGRPSTPEGAPFTVLFDALMRTAENLVSEQLM